MKPGRSFLYVLTATVSGALLLGLGLVLRTDLASAQLATPASAEACAGQAAGPHCGHPAREMCFENRIVVAGSIDAKHYSLVSARIPGTLDAVYVDEGDAVVMGQTKLFQTDSLKLAKAVAIAHQDQTVAQYSVEEKRALLEKSLAEQQQATNDCLRSRKLLQQNAVAAQVLEQQESRSKQCAADVKHTQALIALAEAQLEQASLNLAIAEKSLADSLVLAPINGRVSQRLREPGEMAAAGTPVLRIEDLSLLEVTVYVPEEFYAQVVPGQTKMRVCTWEAWTWASDWSVTRARRCIPSCGHAKSGA